MKGYEAVAKISEIKAILSDAVKKSSRITEDCVCISLETICELAGYAHALQDYVIQNEIEKDKIYE
ncbi:hypothetical protein LAD12857_00750 [Lacrimispora amygdalina]|uniref:Uncharacterized protein n=1 Tax=Lacrimispora amygdalina TaxID=253257 RepID=A0ABQ5M023_9FIRM